LAGNNALSAEILDTLSKLKNDGSVIGQDSSVVHPVILALRDYFRSRAKEATAAKKEQREFLTGVPYVPGKKTRKAPYGTLRWVSEAGSEVEDTLNKDQKVGPGMGKYGWGKALPDGYVGGNMRGKDAGQVRVMANPDDNVDREHGPKKEKSVVAQITTTKTLSLGNVNDKGAEVTVDADDGIPDLTAFIKTLTDDTNKQKAKQGVPLPIIARLLLQTIDEKAMYAARSSILAHLVKLERDGRVGRAKGPRMPKVVDMEVVEAKMEEENGEEDWWYARL
jgi:hypothetical protein